VDSITKSDRGIKLQVSPPTLVFQPNADEQATNGSRVNLFKVTVTNQSREFADFKAEVSAPGVSKESELQWYKIDSKLGSDIPPGESTTFEIQILKVPLPGETQIALDLTISSLKFPTLTTSQKLFLEVQNPDQPLKIQLARKDLQIFPKEGFKIPFVVSNTSSKGLTRIRVILSCTTFPAKFWCEEDREIDYLAPGATWSDHFECKLNQALEEFDSKFLQPVHYFTIDASLAKKSGISYFAYDEGRLKILTPYGVLPISCPKPEQSLRFNFAKYRFEVQNISSSPQKVSISIPESECEVHKLKVPPTRFLTLNPGEKRSDLALEVRRFQRWRDWIGHKKKITFRAEVEVIDPESEERSQKVQPKPSSVPLDSASVANFMFAHSCDRMGSPQPIE
jgi:hypothetical protein